MLAFVVTRVFGVWYADRPVNFSASYDVTLYEGWANQVVHDGRMPYLGFDVEYPPAMMPVIVAPAAVEVGDRDYRHKFIPLMLLFDVAGFIGLLLLARRWGSLLGPWVWTAGGVLLGSVIYLRLDLVPAVATIWALELAARRAWWASGGVFAFGALAKVYPAFLFLVAFEASDRPRRLLAGLYGVAGLILLPFVGGLGDLWRNVGGYHMDRGVQVESTWGAIGMFGKDLWHEPWVGYTHGAVEVQSEFMSRLEIGGLVLSVAVLLLGVVTASRLPRGDVPRLAALMFATMCGLLFFGTVFSPQFVIWIVALAAVALCSNVEAIRWPALMVLPIAGLTHVVFPYFGTEIITGETSGLLLLSLRNVMVAAAGLLMYLALKDETPAAPLPAAEEAVVERTSEARAGG